MPIKQTSNFGTTAPMLLDPDLLLYYSRLKLINRRWAYDLEKCLHIYILDKDGVEHEFEVPEDTEMGQLLLENYIRHDIERRRWFLRQMAKVNNFPFYDVDFVHIAYLRSPEYTGYAYDRTPLLALFRVYLAALEMKLKKTEDMKLRRPRYPKRVWRLGKLKMSSQDVYDLKARYRSGEPLYILALWYGISLDYAKKIVYETKRKRL